VTASFLFADFEFISFQTDECQLLLLSIVVQPHDNHILDIITIVERRHCECDNNMRFNVMSCDRVVVQVSGKSGKNQCFSPGENTGTLLARVQRKEL
jgi:hypothetical protein